MEPIIKLERLIFGGSLFLRVEKPSVLSWHGVRLLWREFKINILTGQLQQHMTCGSVGFPPFGRAKRFWLWSSVLQIKVAWRLLRHIRINIFITNKLCDAWKKSVDRNVALLIKSESWTVCGSFFLIVFDSWVAPSSNAPVPLGVLRFLYDY